MGLINKNVKAYTPEQSAKIIWDTAIANDMNPCFFISKANIESKLLNNAISNKKGTYAGIFQMSDGLMGIKGDDRYNPKLATEATIKYAKYNRKVVEPKIKKAGLVWEDWMYHFAHMQGEGGAPYILTNPNIAIEKSKYKKNIKGNIIGGTNPKTHKDFADSWRNEFNRLMARCKTDMANCLEATGYSGVADLSTGVCEMCTDDTGAPSPYRKKEDLNTLLLIGGVALVAGGALAYFKIGKSKSKSKKGKK